MRSLKLAQTKPIASASPPPAPIPPPFVRTTVGTAAIDTDPLARAERLFGAAGHLVLVSDHGPARSFIGWTLGSSRADAVGDAGTSVRVVVEIMFSEAGGYVVFERNETRLADGAARFSSSVVELPLPADVRRYCESSTQDLQTDAARAAAVDQAARTWHWLKRPGRRVAGEPLNFPFSL
jgi:hypothetical protein